MKKRQINPNQLQLIDFIPAISGLIGKTALVTSFAVVWSTQLGITKANFVFENVRIEMIIGSIITLLAAIFLTNTAPSGTLAPLIVLIPSMTRYGVHPLILSLFVGIIGILSIKTKLFHKLIALSGGISKTGLTLTFGVSGILLSLKNLNNFFGEQQRIPLLLILLILGIAYILLRICKKAWLVIPAAAVISLLVSFAYSIYPEPIGSIALPSFNPSYWWNEMWGIGFGINVLTILKTLPFAFFVLLLWAIDTVSINAMLEASYQPQEKHEEIDINRSFLITSLRNIIGGFFGGAQTSALWRSFLIPLFLVKRPLRPASILMAVLGILAGFTALPIKVLSFPPLIWSVLLFGIFLPFLVVGMQNLKQTTGTINKAVILTAAAVGIYFSPFLTWIAAILYERLKKPAKLEKEDAV